MVKRLIEYIQFNINSIVLATSLFNSLPQYVIVSAIILCFLVMLGLFILLFYYIYRKFNSIDNHTNRKYDDENHTKENSNTYKEDKNEYKNDISELKAKVLPDGKTATNFVDKIIEFKKKK